MKYFLGIVMLVLCLCACSCAILINPTRYYEDEKLVREDGGVGLYMLQHPDRKDSGSALTANGLGVRVGTGIYDVSLGWFKGTSMVSPVIDDGQKLGAIASTTTLYSDFLGSGTDETSAGLYTDEGEDD